MTSATPAKVAIIMGSDSDFRYMQDAAQALHELGVAFDLHVISAHRTPDRMSDFARNAEAKGLAVIIAGAGGAAHLPGMIAAHTTLPVIGVPVPHGPLQGEDALLSIVQMPKGVPVATVAIGNAYNAGLLAAQILAHGGTTKDSSLATRLTTHKHQMRDASLAKTVAIDPEKLK